MIILGYFWIAPQNSQVLKPFFPKTLFSIKNPPDESLKGEVASLSGSVSWQGRTSDFATLINSPRQIEQGEEINTNNNGSAFVVFPKIGSFSLSSNTQISIIQTLPADFVANEIQGTASFQKNGNIPLSVVALDLLINVESGETNITVDKEGSRVDITVSSGSAALAFNDTNFNTNIVRIKKGYEYIFDDNTKTGKLTPIY